MIFAGFRAGRYRHGNFGVRRDYAIVVGRLVFGELGSKTRHTASCRRRTRSGLVLFIVAAPQSLAFILTLPQVPHTVGEMMLSLSGMHGHGLFMLLSIAVLIVMVRCSEAPGTDHLRAVIAAGRGQARIDPLHFGVVLVISMGPVCSRHRSVFGLTGPA